MKSPCALGLQLTSLVASHKVREFTGLDVRGLVQLEDLAEELSKCEGVLMDMQVDDCVQGQVLGGRGQRGV